MIIRGRYSSLTEEGISYTEKEYRFAQETGIPILAVVHANLETLSVSKSDVDLLARQKLAGFRDEVTKGYPVKFWSTTSELGRFVSRSLIRAMKIEPRPRWIRNDGSSSIALLEKINKLTEGNSIIREAVASSNEAPEMDSKLAHGTGKIDVEGYWVLKRAGQPTEYSVP